MNRHNKLFAVVMTLTLAFTMMFASISVNAATVKPKALYLKATATTVDIGGSVKVSVSKVNPAKASKSVRWKSSNTKIATVSSAGKVVGKKTGTVTITATSKVNRKIKKTIKIYVKNLKATSVTISAKEKKLFPGATATLKATVKGAVGFKNQGAKWTTSNASVATVSQKGVVTAVKPGKAVIKAKDAAGGTKYALCTIIVKEVPTIESFNYVNAEYVHSKLGSDSVVLVDVRRASDYNIAHVPSAVSASCESAVSGSTADGVTADNIKNVVDNYGKNKEYILLCYSGKEYAKAATACLLDLGVSSRNIKTVGGDDSAQSSNGGMKAWRAHYPAELTGEISNDTTAHTVTLQCQVANNSKALEHWFIVSKGGSMEKETVLTTNVSTDDFYYALEAVAGRKVWNSGSVSSFKDGITLDQLVKNRQGNADFAKFDVTVSWGGNTYKLSDVISKVSHNGKAYAGTYDIAFAGNLKNQRKEGSGCITCFGGCYLGITSGHDTPMMIRYTPKNLPAVGKTVTVTYTLK